MQRVREVTNSPSPLAQLLEDPTAFQTSSKSKAKRDHRNSSRSRSRDRSASIIGLALVEEERQANNLKSILRSTTTRLEFEIRRAEDMASRAEYAEMRALDATTKLMSAESARQQAELTGSRLGEEVRRYQTQLANLERELGRLKSDVHRLEQHNREVSDQAEEARDKSQKHHIALQEYEAREEGREQARKFAMNRCFDDGWEEGWSVGHSEGYKEGKRDGHKEGVKIGRREGLAEGRERGRNEERRNALEAFDRFLDEEMDGDENVSFCCYVFFELGPHPLMSAIPPTPPSPGFGLRRKGPKAPPRLPLSAFSPPNSGTSEAFPLPPSPSTVNPDFVVDAHVILKDGDLDLSRWKEDAGRVPGSQIGGAVLYLSPTNPDSEGAVSKAASVHGDIPVISVAALFSLEDPNPSVPSYLTGSSLPISLYSAFKKSTDVSAATLRWGLERGRPVDIEIQALISDTMLEGFEDLLIKAIKDLDNAPPIVLSGILPPPHDLSLPIVKLMSHPAYRAFQAQIAALSLFPNVYIKFLPPSWETPGELATESDAKLKKEWKRRIKMYLGPTLEAFGYQRIIYGSASSAGSQNSSKSRDWYEVAKESVAELGVEQEAINAIFYENAKKVYGV
ncbi:hypothetical protein BD779DRAFT_1435577 [Infundibulicybe gibba]|nr:hypothetical protein BD779DRAFT_1435577 [Infundibulicybe gibba]